MSKHDRKEVAKRLREQIEETTDPEQLIKLTREYNRLTNPRYGSKRVSRKPETTPSTTKSSIIDRVTGSALDQLPDSEKVLNWLVVEIEKMQREQKRTFTTEERRDVLEKLIDGLSAHDRAALESWNTERGL